MKLELRQIYEDLSRGSISRGEALDRIRAIKRQKQHHEPGALLLAPVWRDELVVRGANVLDAAEHHVLLCDLAPIDSLLPHSQCVTSHAGPEANIAERYSEVALTAFERIQSVFRSKARRPVWMQIVVPDQPEQMLLAGLSALLKSAALENPQFAGQVVLVPRHASAENLAAWLLSETSGLFEAVVRRGEGVRQVLRLEEVVPEPQGAPMVFRDLGVYLITGGLGRLGTLFAREILQQTREASVVLTGRSPFSGGWFDDSERVSYRQVDLGDRQQVEQLIAVVQGECGPLTGILHCAGMIDDDFILRKSAAAFRQVLEPKVAGTIHLDQATRNIQLDFFTLFSSIAAVVGNPGQSDYAAANGFLDQFAAYRNGLVAADQRHGRTLSIDWTLWQDGGMALDPVSREQWQRTTGVQPMQTATGLHAFGRCVASERNQLLVVEGDLAQMRRAFVEQPPVRQPVRPAAPVGTADHHSLLARTEELLRRVCADVLKLPSHKIDAQAPLERYGIDSILAMKLTTRFEQTFGSLSKTLFFEYQTLRELAGYFAEDHAGRLQTLFATDNDDAAPKIVSTTESVDAAPPVPNRRAIRRRDAVAPAPAMQSEGIAIIGMSGRYPEAVDLEAYWNNLREGKDCIIEVPLERWDWREYFTEDRTSAGHHYSRWGGFIAGVDEFDPLFFSISPKEAKYIDPQERLFLQHAWMAIEDAGYTRAALQLPSAQDLPGQVGVYAGVMYSEYQLIGAESSLQGKRVGIPGSVAGIANRVSYALNLHGPSMTLDTMCSSSLTAIHLACQDLKQGRTSLAIAGGVNVTIHPNKYLALSAGQFISGDGHCQSFGEGGDGYIPGEGVGVVVLKRLSEAKRDGDPIYGVIRGSALNHGGRTNGYTVPNPQAQAGAIARALAESQTDPRHISYIEAHGTGTKLGDPIEIAALSKAFQQSTRDTAFCRIGSAKSNIGHCESAAGIAGLTKVLLQMQHRELVPSLHSAQLNPHIDFPRTPFIVNQTLIPWEQPVVEGRTLPRIAGISSFGAGGSNAHLIIEEHRPLGPEPVQSGNVVIVLSARTAAQLQEKARQLLDFVRARRSSIDLLSLACTLQVGREAMDERLGFVVSSFEQFLDKLDAHVTGRRDLEGVYEGQVKRSKDVLSLFSSDADLQQTIEKWIAGRKLAKLAELWVKGLEVDWRKLYGQTPPQRISLPGYPFAKERHWIELAANEPRAAKAASTKALHPLLHANTSDLQEQRYSSTFSGQEGFLADRGGRKLLPAMACLEMARAAIERAMPERSQSAILELRDVIWTGPIVVTSNEPVSIALFASGEEAIDFEIYSDDAGGQQLHCQGRTVVGDAAPATALDLGSLERQIGSAQSLIRLRVPETPGFMLSPDVLEGAVQAAAPLLGLSSVVAPVALESLRIHGGCSGEIVVWARGNDGRLDLDLCDERGNVFVELRGLSCMPRLTEAAPLLIVTPEKIVARIPEEIAFAEPASIAPAVLGLRKPAAIVLAAASDARMAAAPRAGGPAIKLSDAAPATPAAAVAAAPSSVRLYDRGDGAFAITVTRGAGIAHLRQALERAQQELSIKVLTIEGVEHAFARGGRADYDAAVEQELYQAIASFPYPVVASLPSDTIGAGFLFAALCDFLVCSEEARYGYTDAQHQLYPTPVVDALLRERFGDGRAHDLLYVSTVCTGRALRAKGWTCPIVPSAQAEGQAREFSEALTTESRTALQLLKQHLSRRMVDAVRTLKPIEVNANADSDAKALAFTASHLRIEEEAQRVLVVTLLSVDASAVAELGQLFTEINRGTSSKAVVLTGDLTDIPENLVAELGRIVTASPVPVVAATRGNGRGATWLVSLFCDAAVHSRTATYSAAGITSNAALAQRAAALFPHRYGEAGREMLLTGADYTGADLERRAGAVIVVAQDDVLPTAVRIATSWSSWSWTALTSWKQHAAGILEEIIRNQGSWVEEEPAAEVQIVASAAIPLQSSVVRATVHPGGIVVLRMEERDAKNMFSDALMAGMEEVFAHIEEMPAYKVVILTGYDQYFASGGTKESLLAIHAGEARFTDARTFRGPFDCTLPVIAALQGHGIGAGWSLGMFADLSLLSEESSYASPYMDYGFTPGAGATWSLPGKLGRDLALESLFLARPATGSALKSRGLLLPVVPRAEIESVALRLAQQIAGRPRHHLAALKRQWTAAAQQAVEETLQRELAMHDVAFVGQADVLARIQNRFLIEAPPQQTVAARSPRVARDMQSSVTATLKTLLANELQMQESDIDSDAQFVDLGLDSISGVSWIRKINEHYRTSIEATKVYSLPTLTLLSRYVEAEAHGMVAIVPETGAPEAAAVDGAAPAGRTPRRRGWASRAAATPAPSRGPGPIAIIGMAGQFPQAKDLDAFWQNLAEGRSCITEVPPGRWDVEPYYQRGGAVPGKTNSRWAGALEEFDRFDPLFFNISPTEAEFMDPQQRLFLQACWQSIEHAGYDASALSGTKCGVFVGCAAGEYQELSRRHRLSAQGFTGNATSILAARISYFLNLQGPCVSIDTACSSSLVAIGQACDSLNSGDSDLALAGGVYVMAGPEMHIRTAQAGMLSAEGRCFTFDQRADGFVPGEGVGVVVLKRLADAERDRDIICGVVEGWGVNQDGRTNGITAPNPESQTRLMLDVYRKYAIDPANIQLIEAHGTGTKLGDPIEIEGLKASFRHHTDEKHYCALGSVKSNIGHCLTAAGIAGALKLVLALQHKQLPPTINFERLNEHIDLSDSPFYVNTRLAAWEPAGTTRRQGAISSFGFSGTNAHLVIGEHRPAVERERAIPIVPDGMPAIVPLSAKTAVQLQQRARDLLTFIGNAAQPPALAEIAYTLQTGREAMDERVAFVVSSIAQLADKLQAWIDGDRAVDAAYQGHAKRNKEALTFLGSEAERQETIESWLAGGNLSKVAELWVKGLVLNWHRLHRQARPQRIALPVYPFARDRYWIEAAAVESETARTATTAFLHPLLHANTSDLSQTRFRSTFTGAESVLIERAGQRVLPAVACLEMARAAVAHALPVPEPSAKVELSNTEWGQPIVVDGATDVHVSLFAHGDDSVDYEIYSVCRGREVVHCRGRAVLGGPVESVQPPSGAQLTLPHVNGMDAYVLPPALLEATLQAVASWIGGGSTSRREPFALAGLRIVAPCKAQMVAWVRGDAARLDVDLCDARGNVCVTLRGWSLRAMSSDVGSLLAIPQWQDSEASWSAMEPTERHVLLCELPRVDAARLASLLPRSRCTSSAAEPQGNIAQRYSEHAVACFERLQTIVAEKAEGRVLVQIVAGETEEQTLLAGLSAMVKTAALEQGRLAGQLILVPHDITTDELRVVLQQEQGLEPIVRSGRGTRQILRWQEVAEAQEMPPLAFKDEGVYLITGGLGGLGLLFAREIVERTCHARVVLTGRAAASVETEARLNALSPDGQRVTYRAVDLGDLEQVRQLIADVVGTHGQLNGILHAAGMTADNLVTRKTSAEFVAVLAPKVTGTVHLDEATRDVALDFLVLFSSVASVVGNVGQADYAAANGFMDHFAARRNRQVAARQRQGVTRAINWPLWQSGGMAIDRATQELVGQTIGAQPMQTTTGLQAFQRSLAVSGDQLLVVEGNRAQIRAYLRKARILEAAPDAEIVTLDLEPPAAIALRDLQQQLKAFVATVLGIEASVIDADQPFAEFGLDSFLGAELIVAINNEYGAALSHSRLFDYSTVREFAVFLDQELRKRTGHVATQRPVPPPAASFPMLGRTVRAPRGTAAMREPSTERIAVVGMSGRYPQAKNLQQYWANLAAGKNAIVEVPASRWDVDRHYSPDRSRKDKTYSRWLGALDDVDCFDPLFFRISPQEAEYMDPQHRLFLQESYRAFEDAGYSLTTLSNSNCGVYLGISTSEYMLMIAKKGILSAPVTSNSYAIAAARIAYYLNLKGPAISVDTACSSSLVAIHLACQALLHGEIDMALAGGVSLWLSPDSYVIMSQAGMFSPDGQCKTFDESANGIVNGEGVGAVVLKRLHDAEAAGDLIYGVILGSGINQDGRTNGITAPSVNSQIELERSIYARHRIDPDTITYVETHGTGTKLGDPIELEALSTVFKEKTSRRNFCALGSVKSNIGHTTSAAGVAGLQKVLLCMSHQTLVPTLNVKKENARFDLRNSPFYISGTTQPWMVAPDSLRRAAVSSFGFSGTNAHLVLEEYRLPAAPVAVSMESGPAIVPLSARTPEQLREKAGDLLEFIRTAQGSCDLPSVAWTLQIGREAMEERLAFVVSSVDELAAKLAAWIGGKEGVAGVHQGRVEPGSDGMSIIARDDDMREAMERWVARRKLGALADLWVRGLEIDWNKLHGNVKPRRISLPAYPFAKERCWIGEPVSVDFDSCLIADADLKTIEQIIEQIADDAIETGQAVQALRMLV